MKRSSSQARVKNSPEERTAGCTDLPSVIRMLASFFATHIAEVLPVRARLLLWFHRLLSLLPSRFKLHNCHGQAALIIVPNFGCINMVGVKGDGSGK